MVHYANPQLSGLNNALSLGDGYSVTLQWFIAYPANPKNKIAYHIYYSTAQDTVFNEGVKFVSIDNSVTANILDLTPGQQYWFSVRPVEYDPTVIDFLPNLPIAHDNLRFYPTSMLRSNIGAADLIIPLLDVGGFPSDGIIKVGIELIRYLAVDTVNKNLIVSSGTGGVPAHLVLQSNGLYYLPASTNVGHGSLSGLILGSGETRTETWKILCVEAGIDGYSSAKFEAIGSLSGSIRDGYSNVIIWNADGYTVSNNILTFAITETAPRFQLGDYFTIQTVAPTPGVSSGRGFDFTLATMHTTSGFDGYNTYSPIISVTAIEEDSRWDNIYACQVRFEYPNFPFTVVDGYHQVLADILSTDLSAADAANVDFPTYDYAGYHRTDPVQLLNGTCVGSYIGGEMGCIDANGNYGIYRGFSLQDQNTQRQEVKLSVDGQPAVLIRRVQTGVTCSCYLTSSEYPDDRCPFCYGTKFVFGYEQYFNPRSSDGRIKVRLSPTQENLKMYEAGLESEFPVEMWTLTVPTIKTRDVIVLFDQNDNEEFRYEVGSVTRNKTILGQEGGQTLNTIRIRKFDPAYQIRIFRNTADFPSKLNTSLGFAPGLPPHSHEIVINEKILSVGQINQTTAITHGHNHPIVNGQVMTVLGHTHQIILV